MKDPTGLPMALYQANVELNARIGRLIQDGGRHWLDFGQRLVNDGLVESGTEIQDLLRTQDWQALAALPAEAFWRQMQQRFGDQQAATQIAVAAQTAFARGLQQAVHAWQQDTVQALDGAGLAFPVGDPDWSQLFAAWEPLLASGPRTGRAAPTTAPTTRPAPPAPGTAAKKAPAARRSGTTAARAPAKAPAKAPARAPARKAAKPASKSTPKSGSKAGSKAASTRGTKPARGGAASATAKSAPASKRGG